MSKITIDVGMRIKQLRESHRMSGGELARLLGISQQHLSRYENGKSNIHVDMIFKIKNIFNVDIGYFFDNDLFY